jgi:hypothetical protein
VNEIHTDYLGRRLPRLLIILLLVALAQLLGVWLLRGWGFFRPMVVTAMAAAVLLGIWQSWRTLRPREGDDRRQSERRIRRRR